MSSLTFFLKDNYLKMEAQSMNIKATLKMDEINGNVKKFCSTMPQPNFKIQPTEYQAYQEKEY